MPIQTRDLVLVHTSDVHVDEDYTASLFDGDGNGGLRLVLESARALNADLVLLCGDTFECNRLSSKVLAQSADLLAKAGRPVVILPGNHDPVMEDSVFHKGRLHDIENVSVIGLTHEMSVEFPHLDLEVWGRAHRHYGDMDPLAHVPPKRALWTIAMAHGHYEPVPDRSTHVRASWLIGEEEIAATGADYLALGHWNRPVQVKGGSVPAYYSGSPDHARTVNVVRLKADRTVEVSRAPLMSRAPLDLPQTTADLSPADRL